LFVVELSAAHLPLIAEELECLFDAVSLDVVIIDVVELFSFTKINMPPSYPSAKTMTRYMGHAKQAYGYANQAYGIYRTVTGSRPNKRPRTEQASRGPLPKSGSDETGSDNVARVRTGYIQVNALKKELVGDPIRHYRADNFVLQSIEGGEAYEEVLAVGTYSQWITSTAGAVNYGQSPRNWLSLNPGQGIAAGEHYTVTTRPREDALCLQYLTHTFEFVNMGNTPCFVELAAFKIKQSQQIEAVANLTAAYTATLAAPDIPLLFPAAGAAPTGALNYSIQNVGLPWLTHHPDLDQWRSNYGKLDSWDFQLAAGGRYVLKVHVKMNLIGDRMDLVDGAFNYPKGTLVYTCSSFGSPVKSSSAGQPSTGNIVRSQSKVGCIVTSMMNFRCLKDDVLVRDKRYTAFYNLAANNTLAQEEHMDTDTNAEVIGQLVT